jgi:hypothetical protein
MVIVCDLLDKEKHDKVLRRKYDRIKTTSLRVAQNTEATTQTELPQQMEENYITKQKAGTGLVCI